MEWIDDKQARALQIFHQSYGHALSSWSSLEEALYHWFHEITGLDNAVARAIFFSAKSFNARIDMLESAISASWKLDEKIHTVMKESLKRARAYSSFRNRITHGHSLIDLQPESKTCGQYVLVQGKQRSPNMGEKITIQELKIAARNFNRLCSLIDDIHPFGGDDWQGFPSDSRLAILPKRHLWRVRQLPTLPNSKSNQMRVKRRKQPQL